MATPLIAASAALVRQYFQGGWYPGGSANSGAGFAPSGALVKAVLLGGAAGLEGFESDTGLPLAPPPSFRQGFGRLHLGRSLPLQARMHNLFLQPACLLRGLQGSCQAYTPASPLACFRVAIMPCQGHAIRPPGTLHRIEPTADPEVSWITAAHMHRAPGQGGRCRWWTARTWPPGRRTATACARWAARSASHSPGTTTQQRCRPPRHSSTTWTSPCARPASTASRCW